MSSLTRRALLALGAAALALPAAPGLAQAGPSLAQRAKRRGLFYGCAVLSPSLSRDPDFAALVARESGLLVPEFEAQWGPIADTKPGGDNFAALDAIAAFAAGHGQTLRGHALAWYARTSKAFQAAADPATARRLLADHVTIMCQRYAGRMQSWDVVNEALAPDEGGPDGLRVKDNPLFAKLGESYIDIAFNAARAADPKAMLVYNEYGIENDSEAHERKRRALLALIDRLHARRVPIDAIGLQSHLRTGRDRYKTGQAAGNFEPAVFQRFLAEIAGRGLKLMVTELDVDDRASSGDIASRDQAVAAAYTEYLGVTLASPALVGVVTWGLSDRYSWIVNEGIKRFQRADNLAPRPLPFDDALQPTPAYAAIAAAFDAAG